MSSLSGMNAAQAYEFNGQAVDAVQFTATACDPHRSVVVEACAGSGKTWLLVARMLRLLLDGAEPAELLAITFTRKAAQEMRHRLMELLAELALADDVGAATILRERGVSEQALSSCLPRARKLYENLLNNPQGLSMDTFHSWFGRLLQLAPLASGVPHGFTLVEATGSLQREAWGQLMQQIGVHIVPELVGVADGIGEVSEDGDAAPAKIKQQLLYLYEALGDFTAKVMLDAFIDKRAEWWAVTQDRSAQAPLQQLLDLMGDDAHYDARLRVWQDHALLERIQQVGICLGKGSPDNQKRGVAIETALTTASQALAQGGDVTLEHFSALVNEFYGADGTNRKNRKTKALSLAIAAWLGADNEDAFHDECNAIAETLKVLEKRSKEASVLRLNEALFTVGQAYLDCYQSLKAEQRALDFADLEWQAYRLLSHEAFAAYLHGRLDARYKHILLDEFQDTNPLQWNIISAWLDAYGADTTRPTVFIVGDPKQSIYRFRRADPRVFVAAREMLAAQGAAILRTNQTRRNAPVIVEVLNQAMVGNPIYSAQTTAANMMGSVLRLPLIRGQLSETEEERSTKPFPLRDPLTTPAQEEDDVRRYHEGQQLAQALLQLRAESQRQNEVDLRWSDVMLLVRRRSNLASYEKALREAAIPFVSNRRGGLLSTLEIADLIALLNFLMTPGDNRALAHILKSPIFAASDADLITLATRSETSWWKRLQAVIGASENVSSALRRAEPLLQNWMQAAHDLPVHDLLDRILHQGDLVQRYAQAAPATNRAQIIGNITAFTELALNMDGGRYPSLPKFIAALKEFDRGAENDAPDESNIGSGIDAVRILTIHSAKGLEAKVVAMLDSNHSEAAKDHIGILCAWPLQEGGKKHFSAFGKKDERGAARDALFRAEDEQAEQENWNLLYVAVTRAKQFLILSGIVSDKAADRMSEYPGVQQGSWYQRFVHLDETEVIAQNPNVSSREQEQFYLPMFTPPDLSLAIAAPSNAQTAEQIEGVALHALMERLTESGNKSWPIKIPAAEVISSWLPCALSVARVVREQATAIFKNPQLQKFFDPRLFDYARNEMDIVFQQQILRLDRLVVMSDVVWILDYKRQLLAHQEAGYRTQLMAYQEAIQAIYPMKMIKSILILGDGSLVEMGEPRFIA